MVEVVVLLTGLVGVVAGTGAGMAVFLLASRRRRRSADARHAAECVAAFDRDAAPVLELLRQQEADRARLA